MQMVEYKKTNRKCVEQCVVYEKYMFGEFIGYRGKTNKNTKKAIQNRYKKMGVPNSYEVTLLNGWYMNERKNMYEYYKEGKLMSGDENLVEVPQGTVYKEKVK